MNWSDLSMSQRSELMSIYLKNGITSLDEMKKHYNSFAEGGFASPDHDPKHPYHYHVNGQKVVVTPEDWEKYKDDPIFREVRAAVEAEQAAHPEPEYDEIENPAWRTAYQRIGLSLPNYWNGKEYVQSPLPNGYSRDKRGIAIDAIGNYYAPVKDMSYSNPNVPFFVNNERSAVNGNTVPVRYEQVYIPERTIRQLRQPLPVDRVMNIAGLREDSIDRYIKDNTKQTLQTLYKAPTYYPSEETIERLDNDEIAAHEEWLRKESRKFPQTITKKELQDWFITAEEMGEDLTDDIYVYSSVDGDFERGINKYISVPQNKVLQKKTYTPSRREAEKNAVIKIDDLDKVGTFAKGGKLDTPPYTKFLNTLPDNLRNSGKEYNMRRYWELNNYPKDFNEGVQLGMFTKQDDGYHANSVAFNPITNSYEFMKDRNHPTYNMELDWYYSDDPEAVEFRKKYEYTPGIGIVPDQYTPKRFDIGGPIDPRRFFGVATPEVTDNNIYYSRNSLLPKINITAKGDPRKVNNDYYKAHAAERAAFENRIASREDYKTLNPLNLLEYTPVIGDALDAANVINAASNRNYLSAGIGAGMFLLPNIIEKPLKSVSRGFRNTLKNYNSNLLPEDLERPLFLSHTITGKRLADALSKNDRKLASPSIAIVGSTKNKVPAASYRVLDDDGKYTLYFKPDYIDNLEHVATPRDMYSPTYANAETWAGRKLSPEEVIEIKRDILNKYNTLTDLQDLTDFADHKVLDGQYTYTDLGKPINLDDILRFESRIPPTLQNAGHSLRNRQRHTKDIYGYGEVMPLDFVDINTSPLIIGGGSTDEIVLDFLKDKNFYEIGKPLPTNVNPFNIPGLAFKDGGQIHIKPENRGKFTALKKRTGHSASWFKENGTPAQKKMAVFALNARKWRK